MTCAWMETSSAETGLVRDDEVGIHDNGARDADPLALAAGKLVWVAVRVLADEADELQHLIDLFINDLLVALALDDKPLRNDFADRHAGIQRRDRVLENHLNLCDELCLFARRSFSRYSRLRRAFSAPEADAIRGSYASRYVLICAAAYFLSQSFWSSVASPSALRCAATFVPARFSPRRQPRRARPSSWRRT